MKLKFSSRKWHAWLSFILSLPILLVSVTSILIGHSQQLGFRDIKMEAKWLPGYSENNQSGNEKKPMTLARLIRDLHTGEALFGRKYKWIWDDIVGGSMTFLALTGIYLWWNGQRKMAFAKRVRREMQEKCAS